MAINRTLPGSVIAVGVVERITEQRTGEAKGRRVYAHEITVLDDDGGRFAVRVWLREGDEAFPLPTIGEYVAYVVAISERRDNDGALRAELNVRRALTPGDLDRIHSSTTGLVGAGK